MKKVLLITLFFVATIVGCKKPTEGCRDSNAKNYDANAEKDCCCEYETDLLLWYKSGMDVLLHFNDIDSIYFYLDGDLIGQIVAKTSYYNQSEPKDCQEKVSFRTTIKLNRHKSEHTLSYSWIKDGTVFRNKEIGNYTLESGLCKIVQYDY